MADMMRNFRANNGVNRPITNDSRTQTMNCPKLKKKLQTIDFAIIDTVLYLNAYPNSRQALDYYHKLVSERKTLAAAINEKCGPVTSMGNESRTEWNWVEGPWPWEPDAN